MALLFFLGFFPVAALAFILIDGAYTLLIELMNALGRIS